MHLQHNLIRCALHIDEHITVHIIVHITVPANIRFLYYVLSKILASKNHIYIIIPTSNKIYLSEFRCRCNIYAKKGDWR